MSVLGYLGAALAGANNAGNTQTARFTGEELARDRIGAMDRAARESLVNARLGELRKSVTRGKAVMETRANRFSRQAEDIGAVGPGLYNEYLTPSTTDFSQVQQSVDLTDPAQAALNVGSNVGGALESARAALPQRLGTAVMGAMKQPGTEMRPLDGFPGAFYNPQKAQSGAGQMSPGAAYNYDQDRAMSYVRAAGGNADTAMMKAQGDGVMIDPTIFAAAADQYKRSGGSGGEMNQSTAYSYELRRAKTYISAAGGDFAKAKELARQAGDSVTDIMLQAAATDFRNSQNSGAALLQLLRGGDGAPQQ